MVQMHKQCFVIICQGKVAKSEEKSTYILLNSFGRWTFILVLNSSHYLQNSLIRSTVTALLWTNWGTRTFFSWGLLLNTDLNDICNYMTKGWINWIFLLLEYQASSCGFVNTFNLLNLWPQSAFFCTSLHINNNFGSFF